MISALAMQELADLGLERDDIIAIVTVFERDAERDAKRDARHKDAIRSKRYRANKINGNVAALQAVSVSTVTENRDAVCDVVRDVAPLTKKGKRDSQKSKAEVRIKESDGVNGRAQRLPDDWQPSHQDCAFAQKHGLTIDAVMQEGVKFRNYWTNRTDKQARKPRWDRAWQNWILNMRGANHAKPSFDDRIQNLVDLASEREYQAGIGRPPDGF